MEIEDVNKKIEEKKILERIVELSEEFLQSTGSELNYQKITDDILYISGAKYAVFILYDEDGSKFRTVAISAPEGIIKKVSSLLGFKLIGKKWEHDPVLAEKIKSSTITHFSTLSELTGDLIAKPVVSLLWKTFNIGEVVLVKIIKKNVMLGSFTLIMPANVKFKNDSYAEIYTRQVGLLITRSRSEAKLIESERELRNIFAAVSDPLFLFDQKTDAILDVNDIACSLYGYTRDEMLKLKASDMSAEPETTRKSMKDFTTFVPVRYNKKKDGTVFPVEITTNLLELKDRKVLIVSMRDITERKKTEKVLKESEEIFRSFMEHSPIYVFFKDENIRSLRLSKNYEMMLGKPLSELLGKNMDDLFPSELAKNMVAADMKIMKEGKVINVEEELNGRFYSTIKFPIFIEGESRYLAGYTIDITDSKRAQEEIESLAKFPEENPSPVGRIDYNGKLLYYNHACKGIFKDNDYIFFKLKDAIKKIVAEKIFGQADVELEVGNRIFLFDLISIKKEKYINFYGEDITASKKAEQEILHLSFHDVLTGLYNRRFFEEEIKRLDTERQLPLSFIMGDLNGLKIINDVFGHAQGDNLLKETAKILKKVCRSDDILARWGGDEFVILLPKTSIANSEEIVQRIKKGCRKTSSQKILLSLAIGVATKTEETQDIDKIIIEAESNMYKNKLAQKESNASSIISALEQALFKKSSETMEHAFRMKDNAIKLGKSVKLHPHQLDELSLLASLHDIGKVAIPEKILIKEGKPTEEEWEVIKRHPEIGFNIAQSSPQIVHIGKFILACHENWDGSGYPKGLKGEAIPIVSRIMFICDAYDVMTSERIYKKTMSKDEAIKELRRCAGTQFDPVLVEKFIEIISESSDKTG